jgi:hypothetical protein
VVGDLKVTVSSDLAGFGAPQGPPVLFNWPVTCLLPSLPGLLPWLLVLFLLVLKPNRCGQAWWIWLPLGGWTVIFAGLEWSANQEIPLAIYTAIGQAAGFGLAGVWLLSWVGRRHRALGFAQTFFSLALMSALAFAVHPIWKEGPLAGADLDPGLVLSWGLLGLIFALAFLGAGLLCRRRSGKLRLVGSLLISLLVVWGVAVGLTCLLRSQFGGEKPEADEMLIGSLIGTVASFALLLPFLLLSFANSFYRERLRALLHLDRPEAEPATPSAYTTPPAPKPTHGG